MNARTFFKSLARLAGSIVLVVVIFMATMRFTPTLAIPIWLSPGKTTAPIAAAVLPQIWVFGDPNSENHWHQIEAGGFVILCNLFFWALVIFALWQLCTCRKFKTKERHV